MLRSLPTWRGAVLVALAALLVVAAGAEALLPPEDCLRLVRTGRAAALAGDRDAALERLFEARTSFPDELLPLSALLELEALLELPAPRRDELRTALLTRLRDPRADLPPGTLHFLAVTLAADEEAQAAMLEAAGRRLAAPEGAAPALLELAAEIAQRLERWEEARDYAGRLLAQRPEDRGLLWRCARLDRELGRWASAERLLSRLIELEDNGEELIRAERIETLLHLGRHDEAMAELERLWPEVASDEEGFPFVWYRVSRMAWSLWDAGSDEEARRLWQRIAGLGEMARADIVGDGMALRDRGGLIDETLGALTHLFGDSNAGEALAARYDRAGGELPGPAGVTELNRAALLLATQQWQPAYELLVPITQELPASEEAWFNLGLAAFQLERWEEAAVAYTHAVELNPARPDSHFQGGVALFHLERWEAAVAALERGLEVAPDHWQAHYFLARSYERLGEAERSRLAWESYEAAKPPAE